MDRRTDGWTMQTLELLLYVKYKNMKPCVSNNFVIDFVFDFLKWLLASMSLVLFFMNKNGQSFRDLSSFQFQNSSCLGAMFDVSGRTTHEQGTHISFRSIIYSYNCPIRWIYCKEIVFDLANTKLWICMYVNLGVWLIGCIILAIDNILSDNELWWQ